MVKEGERKMEEGRMDQMVGLKEVDCITLATLLCMCIGWSWSRGEQTLSEGQTTRKKRRGRSSVRRHSHKVPDGSVDELYCIRLALLGHLFQVDTTVNESVFIIIGV